MPAVYLVRIVDERKDGDVVGCEALAEMNLGKPLPRPQHYQGEPYKQTMHFETIDT
jgi:hypothetical protein